MTTTPQERERILRELERIAHGHLDAGWRAAQNADDFRAYMFRFYPELAQMWYSVAADLTADWYIESAPDLPYMPEPAPLPDAERFTSSLSWALTNQAAQDLVKGSLTRTIYDGSRDTIATNVDRERGARWARHASANACGFCRMLATRGAVYASKDTAAPDNRYHDHCHCVAIEVRPGHSYEPPAYVEQWNRDYAEAAKQARTNGGAIDPKQVARLMTSR